MNTLTRREIGIIVASIQFLDRDARDNQYWFNEKEVITLKKKLIWHSQDEEKIQYVEVTQ